jgi:peptide deformylase
MIKPILTQDDEFGPLRQPCVAVEVFDAALHALVEDMWDSMYAARGVGLAATQIGSSLRVAVIDTLQRSSSHRRLVLVNPRIEAFAGEQTALEGCLSMPGRRWPIPRWAAVLVTFQALNGQPRTLRTKDLLARAVQHECDHLDGILCNSRYSPEPRVLSPEPTTIARLLPRSPLATRGS